MSIRSLSGESFARGRRPPRSNGTTRRTILLSSEDPAAWWWMRVSAGVREDKDPTDSLPACATCISLRRSCCAQIRAESVAACTAACFSRRGTKRFWWRMVANGDEDGREEAGGKRENSRRVEEVPVRTGMSEEDGTEANSRWTTAINATPPRENCPLPLPLPTEYTRNILSTRVFHGVAASFSLGREVAHSGTGMAPEEEKRAREEPHDWPCSTILHHEKRSASYGCIYRDHHGILPLIARFYWMQLFGSFFCMVW